MTIPLTLASMNNLAAIRLNLTTVAITRRSSASLPSAAAKSSVAPAISGFGITRTLTVLDAIMLTSRSQGGRPMAHRDDPSDPSRRLEPVNLPGLEERVQARLAEELGWYGARARENQRWYRAIKVVQLVAAALVPVMAGIGASAGSLVGSAA
jgi:hypothetical protein